MGTQFGDEREIIEPPKLQEKNTSVVIVFVVVVVVLVLVNCFLPFC